MLNASAWKAEQFARYVVWVMTALLCGFMAYILINNTYFITPHDEVSYYNAARMFVETGSVRASSVIEEHVSPVMQCNWYVQHFLWFDSKSSWPSSVAFPCRTWFITCSGLPFCMVFY